MYIRGRWSLPFLKHVGRKVSAASIQTGSFLPTKSHAPQVGTQEVELVRRKDWKDASSRSR